MKMFESRETSYIIAEPTQHKMNQSINGECYGA